MKKLTIIFSLMVLAVSTHAQSAKEQVRSVFEAYKTAIVSGQGDKALSVIDQNTVDYYNDMLTQALTADRQTLQQTTLTDQMSVLFLRHKIPAQDLRGMDGSELFVYSVDNKMIGSNLGQIGMGEAQVNGNEATAPLIVNGQEVPAYMKFYKEDGDWKIDITSIMSLAEKGLEMMMKQSGQTRNNFIDQLMTLSIGVENVDELWEPVGR